MTCGTMHCVKICVGMVCQTAHSWVMFSKDLYLVHDTRCQQHSGLEIECIWWKWLGCLITKDAQCRGRLHSPSLRSRQVEHLTRIAHPRYILNTLPFTTAVYVISLQGNRCSQTIITTTKCWLKKHFFFFFSEYCPEWKIPRTEQTTTLSCNYHHSAINDTTQRAPFTRQIKCNSFLLPHHFITCKQFFILESITVVDEKQGKSKGKLCFDLKMPNWKYDRRM